MLKIKRSKSFKKDFKSIVRQPVYDRELFEFVLGELMAQRPLDKKFHDHELVGNHKGLVGCRECHIKPDWLLVYKVFEDDLILYLMETGSHSNLF